MNLQWEKSAVLLSEFSDLIHNDFDIFLTEALVQRQAKGIVCCVVCVFEFAGYAVSGNSVQGEVAVGGVDIVFTQEGSQLVTLAILGLELLVHRAKQLGNQSIPKRQPCFRLDILLPSMS